MYYHIQNNKYKAGHKYTAAKHCYLRSTNKAICDTLDAQKDYPHIRGLQLSANERQRDHWVRDWDYAENRKQSGNGWKENTKQKTQYLRHTHRLPSA